MRITIQQALFGYDGGHQLIAASTALPTEAMYELAVATDLSGTPTFEGFDQSYSGMPLEGTGFYALFSTWLASEMPRPGCVWSHVLLVELADIALLSNLADLRTLFRRPRGAEQKRWREPIQLTANANPISDFSKLSDAACVAFLEAIYFSPELPAVFAAGSSREFEDLVFALWSQQWPKLRRAFRFSTGSFADRGRSGPPFDLQITPKSSKGTWKHFPKTVPFETPELPNERRRSWIEAALIDLKAPDRRGFRTFLNTHGVDIREPRSAFSKLASTFELLSSSDHSTLLTGLRETARLFPDPDEAIRLKETLLRRPTTPIPLKSFDALELSDFLLNDPGAHAYARVVFDYSAIASLLWRDTRSETIRLIGRLIRREESPNAIAFVKTVADTIKATDLLTIAEEHAELIPIMIRHRPDLAFDAVVWRLPGDVQSQTFEALNRLELPQAHWAQILGAMFVSATAVWVRQAIENAGQFAMNGAFRWLEDPIAEQFVPSEGWRSAFSHYAEELLLVADDLTPPKLALTSWFLSPDTARRILSSSRPDVQRLAEHSLASIPGPLRTSTAFLLMTLGLRTPHRMGSILIARSFFFVHEALATRNYGAESWSLLSPELPYLGWWSDWDRCEKLRQAVRRWLQNHAGPTSDLLKEATTSNERVLALRVLGNEDPLREKD